MNSSGGGSQAPFFGATQVGNNQLKANLGSGISNSILNNVNQVTPTGSLTYSQSGGYTDYNGNWVPQWTATSALSPELKNLYDQTLGIAGTTLGQVRNAVGTPLDFSGAPKMPGNIDQVRNDAYNALTARSSRDLAQGREAQKVQLANQGIQPGSEAYNRAMQNWDRATVDASNQATINAGTIAGQDISQAQTLRNQYINELQAQRNQPLADYQSLLGLSSGVGTPQFQNTPQVSLSAPDITAPEIAGFNGQVAMYNQAQQAAARQNAGLLSGLFGLGGSALGGWALGGFK